jgi:carboxypeptidase family protein
MTKAKAASCIFSCLLILVLLPLAASAQSTIEGFVKDTSGAVMPGVTVTAASAALIEKSRTVVTNGQGRYEIIDLRPGTYSVSFASPGFKTVRRDGIDLPANVSVPVYVEMGVGAVGETVEVQAEAPVVDVENAANKQLLTRDVQDSIPVARNMQAMGGLIPGIQLHNAQGGNPDVGGSQQMEQTYIQGHGSAAVNTTVLLDGMNINSNYIDGTIQNYVDNAIIQQATYQTSGITAEVSAGGALVNQIPKDGGNQFHGDIFLSGTGQGGWWQANNISPGLLNRVRFFTNNPNATFNGNSIVHIEDFDGSVGGPILKDRLWFLSSFRYQSTYDAVAGVTYPDGSPGVEDQYIKQGVLRLSWQINSKNKFSGTYDRIQKFKGHELTGVSPVPDNPAVSAQRRGPPFYYVAQGKWTRIQTSKLLFEAGFSTDIIHYSVIYLPGEEEVPFTDKWFSHVSKVNQFTNRRSNAPAVQSFFLPDRRNLSGAVSYFTGTHNIRVGVQDAWGKNDRVSSLNGDLYENYNIVAGTLQPVSVTAFNTPIAVRERVNADLGIFAMDTWHIRRLALTYGVRWEYERSSVEPSAINGGRFVGARSFPQINCDTIKGLGCWKTWAPRVGVVYDFFGNGKTAVKAGFGKYNAPEATGYLARFDPMVLSTDTRVWQDKDLSGKSLATNGDGIAQDNEIGPSTNPNFGKLTNIPKLDPHFKREYNLQYSAGVTHQLKPGVSLTFNWFRRTDYNQTLLQNQAVDPVADWTPFNLINPLDGSTITAYNLNKNAFGRPTQFFQTNADQGLARNTYTGYEMGAVGRLPHGGHVFGGWTIERITDIRCDATIGTTIDGSNVTNSSLNDPNSLRFCDESGKIPFRSDVKVAGNMPIWKGIEGSVAFQSAPEFEKYVNWDVTANTTYPADCAGCPAGQKLFATGFLTNPTERIQLSVPGSRYNDRLNELDLGIKRTFAFREKYHLQAQLDVFNVTNSNTVLIETQSLGNSIKPFVLGGFGGNPQGVLQPRLLRLALQFHF